MVKNWGCGCWKFLKSNTISLLLKEKMNGYFYLRIIQSPSIFSLSGRGNKFIIDTNARATLQHACH